MKDEEYMVMAVQRKIEIEVLGRTQDLPLIWTDGMVGAIPVFKDRKSAEGFMDGGKVLAIQMVSKNEKA